MTNSSPAELVAIVVAARKAGDRELERSAKRSLKAEFGVRVQFADGKLSTTPIPREDSARD